VGIAVGFPLILVGSALATRGTTQTEADAEVAR
jgi:hypothetical protein